MNDIQIQSFLEHWCQAIEDAQTPELPLQERQRIARREIDGIMHAIQNPGVHRLAVNPLLLRILALIHRTGAQLPQKRIELYKLASDTLARTWRPAQGVSEEALVKESALLKEDFLTPLLSSLAYWLHVNKPTGIATEREVYEVLGQTWAHLNDLSWNADDPNPRITEEIRKFLIAVREHTGLLVERAPRRYGFMHLTFEEYYVARHLITHSRKRAKLIRQHLHQARWEEPILLALGFVGLEYPAEASELVETAILAEEEQAQELDFHSSPYEDLLGQDYLFALRCLGDNIPIRPRLLKRLIERLTDELLHHVGPARFLRYRQALNERLIYLGGSTGGSVLLPLLVAALHDADAHVRANAADSLGRLRQSSPEVISALRAALSDADDRVRFNAAWSLGQLGYSSPEAVATLLTALQDVNSQVRASAALRLEQLRQASPLIVSALLAVLLDADAHARAEAARSLGLLGQSTPEITSALLAALHNIDVHVRAFAVWSLGELRQSSPEVISALQAALSDASDRVRVNAAWGLGRVGLSSPEAVVTLLAALDDANAQVRANAALSLRARKASPEIISALLAALHDVDVRVRTNATLSLGALRQSSPEVISALRAALSDVSDRVRTYAAWSLGALRQSSPEVISDLQAALHDANDRVRIYAAWGMGQLGQSSSEGAMRLCEALSEAKLWSVRRDAARFLGQVDLGNKVLIDALWHGLLDGNNEVRMACVQTLVQSGQKDSAARQLIEELFIQAIQDQKFTKPDQIKRPAYDYVYEGLWSLMVTSENKG